MVWHLVKHRDNFTLPLQTYLQPQSSCVVRTVSLKGFATLMSTSPSCGECCFHEQGSSVQVMASLLAEEMPEINIRRLESLWYSIC
jgi:hypothetical protein